MNKAVFVIVISLLSLTNAHKFRLEAVIAIKQNRETNLEMGTIILNSKNDNFYVTESSSLIADPSDKETVLALAYMSAYAYKNPEENTTWTPVPGYNISEGFGWDGSTIQGLVYTSDRVVVIAYKGTSFELFGVGSPTSGNDKLNDNMMFSCCCAPNLGIDPVCKCCTNLDKKICNYDCLTNVTYRPNYYLESLEIYEYVRDTYPDKTIWTTGHSLGGTLGSLVAYRYSLSAILFQSPGEKFYGSRLNHKTGSDDKIFHIGNTGDPIFTGTCGSLCYWADYAMETRCHYGKSCVYQSDRSNINHHRIDYIIDKFIIPEDVPECKPEIGCIDCVEWNYDYNFGSVY